MSMTAGLVSAAIPAGEREGGTVWDIRRPVCAGDAYGGPGGAGASLRGGRC